MEELKNKEIGFLFKKIDEKLAKNVNEMLETIGITFPQQRVLGFINDFPNHTTTQKEIELFLDVSHPSTNGIIRRLEEKKLVTTEHTTKNGRMSKNVTLTEAGIKICKENAVDREVMENRFRQWLTPEEYDAFEKILVKLYRQLS